ncbi:DUF1826 domain-containing protein [Vampirovibrio sp.]|uniref:DUF1826 domain-containing protein n=1 Tax=Vampirovibrio sp. TaxID=2717857 RepID=UPI003594497B
MSLASPLNIEKSSAVRVSEVVHLTRIFEPKYNIGILKRQVSSDLSHFVHQARHQVEFHLKQSFTLTDGVKDALSEVMPASAMALEGHEKFIQDITSLIDLYGLLVDTNQVGIRLLSMNKAMCPGFHVDRVGIRLICTYDGPGTQWLENVHADRSKLGYIAQGQSDENSGLIRPDAVIQSLQPYEVGLLKGEAWKSFDGHDNHGNGIIHRSPAMEGCASKRIVLTLDSLD